MPWQLGKQLQSGSLIWKTMTTKTDMMLIWSRVPELCTIFWDDLFSLYTKTKPKPKTPPSCRLSLNTTERRLQKELWVWDHITALMKRTKSWIPWPMLLHIQFQWHLEREEIWLQRHLALSDTVLNSQGRYVSFPVLIYILNVKGQ